ncbi:hypothetical protein EBB07_13645 [Paenibacillaceae bacterium]|nr:hypothetical protein EBB07_13645 [Paenibacillaceae bacterium]
MEQTEMNLRKKWWIVVLMIAVIFTIGAVNYLLNGHKYRLLSEAPIALVPDYQYMPEQFTELDLSIYDTLKGERISYGMTKADIEQIVGDAEGEAWAFVPSHPLEALEYADGLQIVYRLDRAISFIMGSEGTGRFVTMRNIGMANGAHDHLVAYGLRPTVASEDYDTYLFQQVDNGYKILEEQNYADNEELTVYHISFQKEDGKLVSVSLSDMLFAVKFN